ncbi:MAG: FAD-dependent oxidoreductase, partial [Candidatus Poribacteria bacterium]
MPDSKLPVVIVGAGVIGCSIALELARDGRFQTTLVERNADVGQGSTAMSTAIIRQYYRHAESVKLARSGLQVWSRWRDWLGASASDEVVDFRQVGVLWAFPETSRTAEREHIARCTELGVDLEELDVPTLRTRFPEYAFADALASFGLFEPDGGYVADPSHATRDLCRAAMRLAPDTAALPSAEVVGFRHTPFPERRVTGVVVRRNGAIETLPAAIVVNAAGPHSYAVNALARCPMPLTTVPNRQKLVNARDVGVGRVAGSHPVCIDFVHGQYIKPDTETFRMGANMREDEDEFLANPDDVDERVDEAWVAAKTAAVKTRMPTSALVDIDPRIGVYDVTAADWKPILDKTYVPGYFVAIGTSGAWFKGAPVIGRIMREL